MVSIMVFGQPVFVSANESDSEPQIGNIIMAEKGIGFEQQEDGWINRYEELIPPTIDSSTDEAVKESTSQESEADDQFQTNDSSEIESERKHSANDRTTGTWGSVSWVWDSQNATLILQGGNAGSVDTAPWKIYTAVQSIIVEGTVVLQPNAANLFQNLKNLTSIDALSFDTSQVTTFDFMFANTESLEILNLNGWDTRNVRSINRTFHHMTSLVELDISSWNMNSVGSASTNSWFIFEARNLRTIHLGEDTTFLHMSSSARPVFSTEVPSIEYTGNWYHSKDHLGNEPEERVVTPRRTLLTTFYDGSKPGTYQLEKKVSQPITVKFLDINGNELSPSITLEGEFGSQYNTEAKEISGWTVIELPSNASGVFTEEVQEVIYRYEVISVTPVDPLQPEVEVDPENKPELPDNQGLLSIDFVSSFNFGTQTISVQNQIYYAKPQRIFHSNETTYTFEKRPNYVQISDRRSEDEQNGWQLAITQQGQFKTQEGRELEGASIQFTNQQLQTAQGGKEPELLQEEAVVLVPNMKQLLVKAASKTGTGTWVYRFGDQHSANKSVLLEVPSGTNAEVASYTTIFVWELSTVPDID